MDKRLLGRFGEAKAAEALRRKGWKILAMNFTTRFGEVDIICENRSFLVFAEVKLRKNADFAEAREFVTRHKQQKVILAAEQWLQQHPTKKQPRFDVIEVYAPHGVEGDVEIRHWENAFDAM
ncbi:MAG: YraN family protein [Ruminococcaceae bacterium]|nr:YraN family protein [Oscillospiraceae bacterium]